VEREREFERDRDRDREGDDDEREEERERERERRLRDRDRRRERERERERERDRERDFERERGGDELGPESEPVAGCALPSSGAAEAGTVESDGSALGDAPSLPATSVALASSPRPRWREERCRDRDLDRDLDERRRDLEKEPDWPGSERLCRLDSFDDCCCCCCCCCAPGARFAARRNMVATGTSSDLWAICSAESTPAASCSSSTQRYGDSKYCISNRTGSEGPGRALVPSEWREGEGVELDAPAPAAAAASVACCCVWDGGVWTELLLLLLTLLLLAEDADPSFISRSWIGA
jgi:hypothetical protein